MTPRARRDDAAVRSRLEDTLTWPDGGVVPDNAAVVARVADLAGRAGRVAERVF
jgi:uncharacterized protein (DUF849 family)